MTKTVKDIKTKKVAECHHLPGITCYRCGEQTWPASLDPELYDENGQERKQHWTLVDNSRKNKRWMGTE